MMSTAYQETATTPSTLIIGEEDNPDQSRHWLVLAGEKFLKKYYSLLLFSLGLISISFELVEHILSGAKNQLHFYTEVFLVCLLLGVAYGLIRMLFHSLEEHNRVIEILRLKYNLGKVLSASQDPGEVARRLVQEVGLIIPQANARLYLYEKKKGCYKLSPTSSGEPIDPGGEVCKAASHSLDAGPCRQCLFQHSGLVHRATACRQSSHQGMEPGNEALCLPLAQGATPVGMLQLQLNGAHPLADRQVALLENTAFEMASSLMVAMENKNNEDAIVAQKVHGIQLEIARDLHDTIGQNIGYLRMRLDNLAEKGGHTSPVVVNELNQMVNVANESYDLMRGTLAVLQTGGADDLLPLFRSYTNKVSERTGMPISVTSMGEPVCLPPGSVRQLYYMLREALNNVEKHAQASQVWVEMEWSEDWLRLKITDDGVGFNPENIPTGHYGLRFMRGRVESLQGSITIQSAPGAGTTIHIYIPCQA